ncbi:ABC transporter substrate-binding protein [Pseudonocardia zijingensis]|uniref:Leucine-binding protein domain-containing protein n=1 Tax=Pseudonocardia zijingensis TaxID=153376 RepID=A0ABP4AG00_9PSEU
MSRTRDNAPITAALTLSFTGPYARQGRDAAEGVRLWAEDTAVQLNLVDAAGSRSTAVHTYSTWLERGDIDLLLGPYGSGLTRAVSPPARQTGHLLWNHGGSADDLLQPGIASLLTPDGQRSGCPAVPVAAGGPHAPGDDQSLPGANTPRTTCSP